MVSMSPNGSTDRQWTYLVLKTELWILFDKFDGQRNQAVVAVLLLLIWLPSTRLTVFVSDPNRNVTITCDPDLSVCFRECVYWCICIYIGCVLGSCLDNIYLKSKLLGKFMFILSCVINSCKYTIVWQFNVGTF